MMGLRTAVKSGLRHMTTGVGMLLGGDGEAPRVLCYHGVCADPPDEWSVTPAQLRAHMAWVARHHHPLTLAEVLSWLEGGAELPPRAVAVTFDDGFTDVLMQAAPILAEAGVPGAAFVATRLVARGAAAVASGYVPARPIMDWQQVRELHAAGWTIGSHSLTHPRLAGLPEEEARRELCESRAELEQQLGGAVRLLAYPYGTAHTVSIRDQRLAAQAGYRAAFMDMTAPITRGSDPLSLPRSKVLGTDSFPVVRASLRGEMDLWRLIESRH